MRWPELTLMMWGDLGRSAAVCGAAAVSVWLLALLVTEPAGSLTADDAAYGLAAETRDELGSWSRPYEASDVDPARDLYPYGNFVVTVDGQFPYVQHPMYVHALASSRSVLGSRSGLRLWGALGVGVVVASGWLLARRWSAPAAMAVAAGVSSPIVVQAMGLWAHAPAAGCAAVATVALVDLVDGRGRTVPRIALLGGALVLGALLRSEGVLFGVAVGVVLTAVAVRRRSGALGMAGVAAGLLAVGTYLAEARWVASITGGDGAPRGVRQSTADAAGFLSGRASGAYRSLLRGHVTDPERAVLVFVALALVVWAAFVLRSSRPGRQRPAAIAVVVGAGLLLGSLVRAGPDLIPGLLPAWPVGILGLVGLRRADFDRASVRVAALVVLVYAVAVLATQYEQGGGAEWGGRFFALALPALIGLAAVGVGRVLADQPAGGLRVAVVALAAVGPVVGLVNVERFHDRHAGLTDDIASGQAALIVTDLPFLPDLTWPAAEVSWLLAPEGEVVDVAARVSAARSHVRTAAARGAVGVGPVGGFDCRRAIDAPVAVSLGVELLELRRC